MRVMLDTNVLVSLLLFPSEKRQNIKNDQFLCILAAPKACLGKRSGRMGKTLFVTLPNCA